MPMFTDGRPAHDWPKLLAAAKAETRSGVRDWVSRAQLAGGLVNSVTLTTLPGTLISPVDFEARIKISLIAAGASNQIGSAWAAAVSSGWKNWAAGFRIPGVAMYPSFAAFPGPFAPPTPNLPRSVGSGVSGAEGPLSNLGSSITQRIGGEAFETGAPQSIAAFSNWFFSSFFAWKATAVMQAILGQGPVPSFAPPANVAGPVVGGSIICSPGFIVGAQFGL